MSLKEMGYGPKKPVPLGILLGFLRAFGSPQHCSGLWLASSEANLIEQVMRLNLGC